MPHIESSMTQSQEPPRPSEEGQTPEPDGADWRQKAAENLAGVYKAKINPQEVENSTPRNQKERDSTAFRAAVKQMEEVLREALEKQDQEIQAMSDEHTRAKDDLAGTKDELAQTKDELARIKSELARTKHNLARTEVELAQTKGLLAARSVELAQTKELLAARSVELVQTTELLAARTVELVKVQPFLSTMDRISEAEVLGIVRDLNDNIIQIAANLTEGWGKLQSPRSNKAPPNKKELDALSQFYGPTLVRRVLNQDPSAVALLVRSILCYIVTQITLSWRRDHDQRSWILGSIYRRLSASEGQAISARWRALAQSYLPKPSIHCISIANHIADVLSITGSFQSTQRAFDFVKAKAGNRVETINRLAMRLEYAFMVDIASSDMRLLFEAPSTAFDEKKMSKERDKDFTPGGQVMKVAGTTEVGVEKTVYERRSEGQPGEGRCTTILLKAKVVLEKDVADLVKVGSGHTGSRVAPPPLRDGLECWTIHR